MPEVRSTRTSSKSDAGTYAHESRASLSALVTLMRTARSDDWVRST